MPGHATAPSVLPERLAEQSSSSILCVQRPIHIHCTFGCTIGRPSRLCRACLHHACNRKQQFHASMHVSKRTSRAACAAATAASLLRPLHSISHTMGLVHAVQVLRCAAPAVALKSAHLHFPALHHTVETLLKRRVTGQCCAAGRCSCSCLHIHLPNNTA